MRAVCVVACLSAAWTLHFSPQQKPVFRSGVQTVEIYATVRGDDGRLVLDLTKDDFEIRDKGVVQDVTIFSREAVPITVVILVDVSGSQTQNVAWSLEAARAFIGALTRDDRARVGTFGKVIALSAELTSDKTYLKRFLDQEVQLNGGTPLWQAIDLSMNSLRQERGRRVILAVTDGFAAGGSPSKGIGGRSTRDPLQLKGGGTMALPMPREDSVPREIDQVKNRTVREAFMIYAVGREVASTGNTRAILSKDMQWLAAESGGGYRLVPHSEDGATVMAQVAEELHHQYLIGFTPTVLDGKVHNLEVKMKRRGLEVRARKSYVAAK